jgi:hypothetical protein
MLIRDSPLTTMLPTLTPKARHRLVPPLSLTETQRTDEWFFKLLNRILRLPVTFVKKTGERQKALFPQTQLLQRLHHYETPESSFSLTIFPFSFNSMQFGKIESREVFPLCKNVRDLVFPDCRDVPVSHHI